MRLAYGQQADFSPVTTRNNASYSVDYSPMVKEDDERGTDDSYDDNAFVANISTGHLHRLTFFGCIQYTASCFTSRPDEL